MNDGVEDGNQLWCPQIVLFVAFGVPPIPGKEVNPNVDQQDLPPHDSMVWHRAWYC